MSSRFKSGILLVCGVAALNENWWLMQRSCRNEFRRVGAEEEEGESINQMIRLIDSIRLLKWIDRKKSINQMWAGLNWLDSLQLNAHLPAATISHDFIHLFRSIAGKLILIAIQTLNLIGNFPLITHTHTQHNNNIMIYISIDVEYFWDLIGDSLRGSNRIKIKGGGGGGGKVAVSDRKRAGESVRRWRAPREIERKRRRRTVNRHESFNYWQVEARAIEPRKAGAIQKGRHYLIASWLVRQRSQLIGSPSVSEFRLLPRPVASSCSKKLPNVLSLEIFKTKQTKPKQFESSFRFLERIFVFEGCFLLIGPGYSWDGK